MNNKLMKTILVIMVAALTFNMSAQNEKHERDMLKDLNPEELAELKTKKMTLHLDLNESQQAEIKSIILEEAKLKQQQRSDRDKGKNSKPSKEEQLQRMNDKLDREIEMKSKMKSILNEEQFEKWEQMKRTKGKKRRKQHGRE